MLSFPNAKINIGLYVTEKRTDGYHNLETVFYPVQLSDALEVLPAAKKPGQMHISGLPVPGNTQDNLVWKAYSLLQSQYPDRVPALDIFLHKQIPMGAGLGGGSADAAFLLKLVNEYCRLGLNSEQLARYALQLGSDCPFFIYNKALFATGRGEQFSPVNLDLSAYQILLVCPPVTVATRWAFQDVPVKAAPFDLRTIDQLPLAEWRQTLSNDFEKSVFARYTELAEIKDLLYRQGALYASLSGSGSVLYGIFPQEARPELQGNFKVWKG